VPGYFRPEAGRAGGGDAARPAVAADPHAATLVAESGERPPRPGSGPPVIGAVLVRVYDTPSDPTMVPRRRAHVEALVVDQAHRRAGVGTALMKAVTAWANERGAVEVVLTVWAGNQAAEAFYQRLGYQVVSRAMARPV
jgi:ribosomal protein S18 acetylase RimI-like enzyme